MTMPTFLLILTGVLLNAGAQLLLKAGVAPLGALTVGWSTLLSTAFQVLGQWPIIAGLTCYVVSVAVWIIGLSRVEVSIAYPMLSLGYVVNAVAVPAPRRPHRQQKAGSAADRDPKPGLPVTDAKGLIGQGRHPQMEGRLLEIFQAVVADRHPVAAGEHLTCDLGIATLVRRQQMPDVQGQEPDCQNHRHQPPDRWRGCLGLPMHRQ